MIDIIIKIIKRVPWILVLLISFWLVVLGILAYRYFNIDKTLQEYLYNDYHAAESATIDSITAGASYQIMRQLNNGSLGDRQLITLANTNTRQFINLEDVVLYTEQGELHAVYNNANGLYTLFFNQVPISQIANPNVIYAFKFNNNNVILIFDAEVVDGSHVYSMLEISNSTRRLLHELGNSESMIDATLSTNGNCIFLKFQDARKYTEEGDFQVYQYCGGNSVFKILEVKSEDYYQQKFSTYTARQIVHLAKNEHCLDTVNKGFYLTKECNYGIKYCYMFRQINNPARDSYYKILDTACSSMTTSSVYQMIISR